MVIKTNLQKRIRMRKKVETEIKNECPKGCKGLTYMHDDHEKRSCCVCNFVYPNDTSSYIILNKNS